MSYQGIYINLDRSAARRAALETELARLGLTERYQRLPAVDGNTLRLTSPLKNPNEIGCFLSHVEALKAGLNSDLPLHIIEDDTVFAACAERTLNWAITSGVINDFDILYTDIAMPLSNESYRTFKSLFDRSVNRDAAGNIASVKFQTLNLQDIPFLAASSYLVNKNSVQKLLRLYDNEIAAGVRIPIDLFLPSQAKVGAIKIGCLFPFVTSINVEETLTSTIRLKPDTTKKFTAANIGRYSFFVDCNWDICQNLMHSHIVQPPPSDRHAKLLTQLLAFSLIDQAAGQDT
jgi:GR25 family glycosyltransferase involved in LPS biosynthesis